jgi:hypothetical protein
MKNLTRCFVRGLLAGTLALSFGTPVLAADETEAVKVDVTGKGVFQGGSKGKYREDYNIQSGADIGLEASREFEDGGQLEIRGLGQTGEKQGFLRSEYGLPGFSLNLDLQAWTEYYNDRTGEDRPSGFPNTNNGRFFYGSGLPSTDWFTVGGDFDVDTPMLFHDVYGGFHYRDVNGDQTTQKSGTADVIPPPPPVPGSGPGSVDFSFPGRKKVDYDAYMALIGGTSGLGNINWQSNVTYQYNDNQSKLNEPIYTTGALEELDRYDEDSDIQLVRYDLSAGRHLASNLYVFGSGFFSYERSDPEPEMQVSTGGGFTRTRWTTSSKVTRYTPAMTMGTVYTPARDLVVSADTSLRGYIQEGDLDEFRDESAFLTGDFGSTFNHVDRDSVVSTTRITADWKATSRITVKGEARYQYRWEDVDSKQDTVFVVLEPREREKYESDQHRAKLGASMRYRMNKGRSVEGGYQFFYTHVSQDIDQLENQFILGDYHSMKHRVFLKASGRLMKKLRGELRAQYIYERRDMDAPSTEPVVVANASDGKTDTNSWDVSPALYYMLGKKWSLFGNYRIGMLKIEPDSGSTFEYKVLTQSLTAGVSWSISERLRASTSYTGYINDDDVKNIGTNVAVTGDYDINDRWSVNGGYRYLGYDLDDNSLDDYDTHVVTLGVTGRF